MNNSEWAEDRASYSVLLRIISGLLFLGAALTIPSTLSSTATLMGLTYQVTLLMSGGVVALSALGIWRHKKWGAWSYIGLTMIDQPLMYIMGWWSAGALIVPTIVIVLLVSQYKWLR